MTGPGRGRWGEESGSALVAALVLTMIVMMLGVAVLVTSQSQVTESATSRTRDSSFELAEGALYAQGFLLPANWPGAAASATTFPTSCSSAAATSTGCPDRNTLAAANASNPSLANFSSGDYQAAFTSACPTSVTAGNDVTCWITEVRDDGAPLCNVFKASQADVSQTACPGAPTSSCPGPCRWDANGNKQVWVYARAFVHGKARAMAAKLKLETLNEGLASAGFRVGHVSTDNNGNKVIVDASGAQVLVNCDPNQSTCVDARSNQVTPAPAQIPGGANQFMTADQLARFKATAQADGHYYDTCPPNNDLSGKVVWVENCNASVGNSAPTVSCSIGQGKCMNTKVGEGAACAPQNCPAGMLGGPGPGLLIWHHGTLALGGNVTYVGTIYMPNGSDEGTDSSNTIFSTSGTAEVYGSLAIDGHGGAVLGASKENFVYDSNSSGVFKTFGTAGLVQNTWQELPPSGG